MKRGKKCAKMVEEVTALHRSLSKYLTAQDTCDTPTLTKHNKILARLDNLLYLQPQSTIKVNRVSWSLLLCKLKKKKTKYSSELVNKIFSFPFPEPNRITQWLSTLIFFFNAISCTHVHFLPIPSASSV